MNKKQFFVVFALVLMLLAVMVPMAAAAPGVGPVDAEPAPGFKCPQTCVLDADCSCGPRIPFRFGFSR